MSAKSQLVKAGSKPSTPTRGANRMPMFATSKACQKSLKRLRALEEQALRQLQAAAESPLEKALNRLLWKMPKPPGCETAEDVADWISTELREVGIFAEWDGEEWIVFEEGAWLDPKMDQP